MATDLQHAARQRSDLVVRRQQLPARQGAVPVRPAVLERRFDAHAGGDAQLLPAQDVPGEQAGRSRAASRSAACRSISRKVKTPAFILSTSEDHIAPWKSTYAATQIYQGPVKFVPRRLGPYRRRRQSAGPGQIRPLGERPSCRQTPRNGSPGAKYATDSWWPAWEKWVAQYRRRRGAGAPARRRQAQADRGRARLLRAGEGLGHQAHLRSSRSEFVRGGGSGCVSNRESRLVQNRAPTRPRP